jgi:hypothetical protein
MLITLETMVVDLIEEHPEVLEVFKRFGMERLEDPSIRSMATGATIDTAAAFAELTSDRREAFLRDLNEAIQQ